MIEKIRGLEGLVNDDERILNKARIHEIVFAPSIIYTIIAILVGLFFHPLVGAVIFFLALYPIYNAFIQYNMTYLIMTDKKVMSRAGFLTRDWIRMDFDRVENAYLEEPILGRALGYSTIIVSGVGSGSISVPMVRNGDTFIKQLDKLLSQSKTAK